MATAAITGCAGYTGQETLDRVLAHPELDVVSLGSDSLAGLPAAALDPRLEAADLPEFVPVDDAVAAGAEVVFLCLASERAAALQPLAHTIVVDLSGAPRLPDVALYPEWHGS